MTVTIRALTPEDRAAWEPLFQGYGIFYKRPVSPETADKVWSWLMDSNHVVEGLLALDGDGKPVGIAHFRALPRPLAGQTAGFLDDLFVDPSARGSRVADAILERLQEIGRARGWPLFRWLTADDNFRARSVYDRHSTRTHWITYEMSNAAKDPA